MTDEEIKNTITDTVNKVTSTVNNTKNFVSKNKISIIAAIVGVVLIATGIFLGGFLTARKIYRVESVDQQVVSLQNKLDEATSKLNEIQSKYDELIALNDKMSDQATSVRKDIEDVLRIVDTSKVTINEIKNLANNGNAAANDARSLINTIMQNNAIIKDKVIVLEQNLEELRAKIIFVPEQLE